MGVPAKFRRSAHMDLRRLSCWQLGPLADAKGRVGVQFAISIKRSSAILPRHSSACAFLGVCGPGVKSSRRYDRTHLGTDDCRLREGLGYDFEGGKNRIIVRKNSIAPRTVHSPPLAARRLERLDSVEPVLPLGKTFWALTNEERDAIVQLIEQEEMRSMITSLQGGMPVTASK